MSELDSIIERMKQVTGCQNDTKLAEYLGLKSNSAISTWRARNKIPYAECDRISRSVNVDLGWLITGKQSGESIFPQPLVANIDPVKAGITEQNLTYIPEYDQPLAAGGGSYPVDHALAISMRPFSKDWLTKKGLKQESLKLLRVMGESMEPLLKDKDMVMIDTSRTQPNESMPFAIRLDGNLFVKHVQTMGNGNLLLVSRNSSYRDIEINRASPPDDFAIVGGVVWHAHSWI